MREYRPESYWQQRLSKNFSLGGVGHSGLGLEYNKWLYKARIRALNKLLKGGLINPRGKQILDIGCGTGFYIDYWQRLGAAHIVGLDITEISISRVSAIYPDYRFLKADITAEKLELSSGFDIITAFDVLFHIVDEDGFEQAIRNIRSVSRKDTRILIMDNFLSRRRSPGFHENDRTIDSYQQVLAKNGLEMVVITPIFYFMNTPIGITAVRSRFGRTTLRYCWSITRRLISLGNRMWLPGRVMNYLLGGFLYGLDGIILKYAKDGPSTKLLFAQLKEKGQKRPPRIKNMSERVGLKAVRPKGKWDSKEEYLLYLRSFAAYVFAGRFAANKSILEIGCGAGYGVDYLSRFASSIVAADIQKEAIAYCQAKYGRDGITFMLADGTKLPFNASSFDMVISFQVIEHIEPRNVLNYLSEIKRVLKEDGVFLVSTPNPKLRLLPFQKPWNPEHKREYKDKELQRLLNTVFDRVKIFGLCGSKEILSIERNRVRQKPLKVYVIRPYHHLLYRLYQLLGNLSPPAIRRQLERLRDIRRSRLKSRKPIIHPVPQEQFLGRFSTDDFRVDPSYPKDSLDLIGICTKK